MKGALHSESFPAPPAMSLDQVPSPPGRSVLQMFQQTVEATPDGIAVVSSDRQLTYGELNARADSLAAELVRRGIRANSLVGLCVDRSPEMIVAVLGILKAGAAYLPLDPAYPKDRLAFILADAQPALRLTTKNLSATLPPNDSPTLFLDEGWPEIAKNQKVNLPSSSPENLAYVLYTSGSTGQPKGVAMPHRPPANLIAWQLKNSRLTAGNRTLQFASLNFDVSFQEIFATLGGGGVLVLAAEALKRDPAGLLDFLRAEKINRVFLPVVALQLLAEAAAEQENLPGSLREIITAGEQLRISPPIRRMFERLVGCRLHNHYGPTESHVATAHELSGAPESWPDLPPIGRPITNAKIYLLDENFQRVPDGATGEIFIGGDVLADGYHRRPELTAQRFMADPFSKISGSCLYKTGDLARVLPDGNLEFIGRNDDQVKIRGHRVELGEIESALLRHPAVRQAAVVASASAAGEQRLAAYLVGAETAEINPAEAREFLRGILPDHMVPPQFIIVPNFPLTPSGKVDRRALRARHEPEKPAPKIQADELEQKILSVWREVLPGVPAGLDDNFFDAGGNSINLAQVHLRLQKILGRNFPLTDLFAHTTVRALAGFFGGQDSAAPGENGAQQRALNQRRALKKFRASRP